MKNIKSPLVSQGLITLAIIVALILLLNPFNFIMTSVFTLTLIMILAAAMLAFSVLIWREKPRDEREALQGLQTSRLSYFAGASMLVLAVITEAFKHRLDGWLVLTLAIMVVTKLAASIYNHYR